MATDLGRGVSTVYDNDGYNYDMVVFQKGKPPLDAELNLAQELQNLIARKNLKSMPSGWLTLYPYYADRSLGTNYPNKFFTQNPSGARPEFALVNGQVLYVTNTSSTSNNANLIDLGTPPVSGNIVNGVFLEMWRALLDPNTNLTNGVPVKPDASLVVDTLNNMYMMDENNGWICGTNGLILKTADGGNSWTVMAIDTKRPLNAIHFVNSTIGWVVGGNGVIGRSSSGGQTWTMLTSPTVVDLNSVFAASQTTVWAVGDNGTILKASNGVTFVPVTSGVTNNLNDVFFSDATHGWIVGDKGLILSTNNGGISWTQTSSGTLNNLNAVCFYNTNFGFAVGDNGTILGSSNGGGSWVSQSNNVTGGAITNNLRDVAMFPKLDEIVTNEEVSSQLGAIGTSFTTMHTPITGKNGKGVISNNPADVTVRVNGVEVPVIGVNGLSGLVVLASPPGPGAVTKIDYHYQSNCAVFQGKAWVVGDSGRVLATSNIGATWTAQNPSLTVVTDLISVAFVSQETGWLCGGLSVIRNTQNGGTTWTAQVSDVFSRQVQRVWQEGNTLSSIYLDEDTIHPDALIETTKRVQVQYRIRVIEAVDPLSHPEAGLSSNITGKGPNATGSYGYENMGPINGDYGCWRAKCPNTVDGYCYAIPMAFVNRRNQQYYSVNNLNGQHEIGTSQIRPDLLLAKNVVPSDILDIRRKVVVPSVEELFFKGFDALSSNVLKTNFARATGGGDRYGTEILRVDTKNAASGLISSQSQLIVFNTTDSEVDGDGPVNPSKQLDIPSGASGIFHPDPSHHIGRYYSGTTPAGFVPGHFSGLGSSNASFVYNQGAKGLPTYSDYIFSAEFIADSTNQLTYPPSNPQLVISSAGTIYQGVLDSTSKIIEAWDSGISGYQNYAVAYSAQDTSNVSQMARSSPVEVHYFTLVDSSNSFGGVLSVKSNIIIDSLNVPYRTHTVREVYNRTSGFAHRISDLDFTSSMGTAYTKITPAPGYEFINGTILEVISDVNSDDLNFNVRNGAAVNFNSRLRGLNSFTRSVIGTTSGSDITMPVGTEILGWSTTTTVSGLTQAICWDTFGQMREAVVTKTVNPEQINISPLSGPPFAYPISIQLLVKKVLTTETLTIGYNYIPSQCQNLPNTLTIEPLNGPLNLYVSNLGSGGGGDGKPYNLPLEHIPVNSDTIINDQIFNNFAQLKLANYMVSSGFIQLPVNVPGSFLGNSITLSGATQDSLGRIFYSTCSREMAFEAEGLQLAVPRKVYLPVVARVQGDNSLFMNGEYILVIFSRPVLLDKENKTGYFANGDCSISVYRFPNRPISR